METGPVSAILGPTHLLIYVDQQVAELNEALNHYSVGHSLKVSLMERERKQCGVTFHP